MWRIGRLIKRGEDTYWNCFLDKGDCVCGFETRYSPENASNVKARHAGCFGNEPISDAMVAWRKADPVVVGGLVLPM